MTSYTGRLNELSRECLKDSRSWFPDVATNVPFLALAYAGEAGEFGNVVKKVMRGSLDMNDPKTRVMLAEELTDGFIYMLNLAAVLGIDLEKTYERVRAKNQLRFGKSQAS